MLSLDIQGEKAVKDMIKTFGREGKREVIHLTSVKAKDIEFGAKSLAKVKTGAMKNSIKAEKVKPLAWTITAYEKYSIWQEFGKKNPNYPFKPFMRPAWKRGIKSYVKDLNDIFKKLTKKYNG